MCGIVGYVGEQEVLPILLEGLKKLEYRGYDSSGISIICNQKIQTEKASGKIVALEEKLHNKCFKGTIGIAHTRWATHGAPIESNAHPHCSYDGKISVVHNGIIENYAILKSKLETEGITFVSDTDTEVIAHLIARLYKGDIKPPFLKPLAN